MLKEQLQSSYSSEGILTIHAPRKINAPEGAEVQEAMASASKAFTTDDGKTQGIVTNEYQKGSKISVSA